MAELKAKASEVVESAQTEGRKDGKTSGQRLWERLRCPPSDGVDVEFERPNWAMRKVEF